MGIIRRQIEEAFPTNSRPRMTDGPDAFVLELSRARARVLSTGVLGGFAFMVAGIGLPLARQTANGQPPGGTAVAVVVLSGLLLLGGIVLAMRAKRYRLTVAGAGITMVRGKVTRHARPADIVDVRYGQVLHEQFHQQGRSMRDQLEVHLTDGSSWWLVIGDGGPYMQPLAAAIGRFCSVPVYAMGKVVRVGSEESLGDAVPDPRARTPT